MLLNQFLDSPLVSTERNLIFLAVQELLKPELQNKRTTRQANFLREFARREKLDVMKMKTLTARHYPIILRRSAPEMEEAEDFVRRVLTRTMKGIKKFDEKLPAFHLCDEAMTELKRSVLYTKAIDRLQRDSSHAAEKIEFECKTGMIKHVYLSQQICCLVIGDVGYIGTYDQFLMLKDCHLQRANVYAAAEALESPSEARKMINQILKWCESCWLRYGEKGADILKSLECIAKSMMTEKTCPIFSGPGGTLAQQHERIQHKERKMGYTGNDLLIDRLVEYLHTLSVDLVVEAFGLMKLSGHPLISPAAGGASACQEAKQPCLTTQESKLRVQASWRRMYIIGYIKRSHRWPALTFSAKGKTTSLYSFYTIDDLRIHKHSVPLSDWNEFEFTQHHEFDYFDDYLELLSDKTLSYGRSEAAESWKERPAPSTQKRLFLELCKRESFNIKEIFERIANEGIPYEWRIVSLYAKEREFKIKARMFAMLVLEMRTVLNCLEANVADAIFPNIEEQTMTLSKDEILHKFFRLLQKGRWTEAETLRNKHPILCLEADLSRWNLWMRLGALSLIAHDLNQIFGVIYFLLVHPFFEHSMIMVRHPSDKPKGIDESHPPESDLLWYNHLGGFEGLSQKIWTLLTYAFVDLAMEDFAFPYTLIGQGDNQVLIIELDKDNAADPGKVNAIGRKVASNIEREALRVNQIAKPEECLYSTTVITYSKDIFIRGALRYTSLKSASRILFRSVDDMPALASRFTGAFSTAVGAAAKSCNPIVPYYIAVMQCAFGFNTGKHNSAWWTRNLRGVIETLSSPELFSDVLACPPSLGGICASLGDFLYRGAADQGTKELAVVMRRPESTWAHYIVDLLLGRAERDTDPAILLEVPSAFPVWRGGSLSGVLKRELLDSAKGYANNKDITEILMKVKSEDEKRFKEAILSMTPLNPFIARDLVSLSAYGTVDEIFQLVTCARTAVGLRSRQATTDDLTNDPPVDISSATLIHESLPLSRLANLVLALWKRKPTPSWFIKPRTGFEAAVLLRSFFEIEIVGVSAACPIDYPPSIESPSIGVRIPRGYNRVMLTSLGDQRPLFGMKTAGKVSQYGYKIATRNKGEKALSKLTLIYNQSSGALQEFAEAAIHTRTSIDLKDIMPLLGNRVGGTIHHRYMSDLKDRSATANGAENLASFLISSTNSCGTLSGGTADYPLMFQEFLAYATSLIPYHCSDGDTSFGIYAPQDLPEIFESVVPIAKIAIPAQQVVDCKLSRVSEFVLITSAGFRDIPGVIPCVRPSNLDLVTACFVRATGYDESSAMASINKTLTMDFAEVSKLSLPLIMTAAANAAIIRSASIVLAKGDTRRSSILHALSHVVLRIVQALLSDPSISPHLSYELRRIKLGTPTVRYASSTGLTVSLFVSNIMQCVVQLLEGKKFAKCLVFVDDNEEVVSTCLSGALARIVLAFSWEDPRIAQIARSAYSVSIGLLRKLRRSTASDTGKETQLATMMIADVMEARSHLACAEAINKAMTKGLCARLNEPLAAARRRLRLIPPPVYSIPPAIEEGYLADRRITGRSYHQEKLLRKAQTPGGGIYSAQVAYSILAPLIDIGIICIVGVGDGAGATVLCAMGCMQISGVDKTSDLSLGALTTTCVQPTCLIINGYESRFSRLSCQKTGRGTWPEADVIDEIRRGEAYYKTVILDYSTMISTYYADVRTIRQERISTRCVKRVITRDQKERLELNQIAKLGCLVAVVFLGDHLVEAWLDVSNRSAPEIRRGVEGIELVIQSSGLTPLIHPTEKVLLRRLMMLHGLTFDSTIADAEARVDAWVNDRQHLAELQTGFLQAINAVYCLREEWTIETFDDYFTTPRETSKGLSIRLRDNPENRIFIECLLVKTMNKTGDLITRLDRTTA